MKALLLSAPGRLDFLDVPDPSVGPDDVLIRVRAAGICGSDVHGMDGSTGRRIPPLIMGHEAAGVIEAVGGVGHRLASGRRRHVRQHDLVRRVPVLRAGPDQPVRSTVGCSAWRSASTGRDGAFAELVAVPARILYALPAGAVDGRGRARRAAGCGAHAVSRAPVAGATPSSSSGRA